VDQVAVAQRQDVGLAAHGGAVQEVVEVVRVGRDLVPPGMVLKSRRFSASSIILRLSRGRHMLSLGR
jgi:hypothetical protein